MTLLDVSDIHTYYGESHILEGVSLEIDEGEVVALLGRNGVGKTTTMRSILQLTPPVEGTITFDGEELVGKDTYEVAEAGIGWIPEERRMFTRLSVEENIRAAVPDSQRVPEALETAYETFPILKERSDQRAGDLSGGQQQMLAIARGLVGDNDLLLVDEPSEGLAPQIVTDVGRALMDAAEEIPILLVEQKLGLALDLADRFYVMDHGQIIDEGETSAVSTDDERLRRYLSA
ncbi:ATP-binding cassette domain-containing protein [Halovenus sp. WSH3]|uniref:ATP-binding cassette domain-containing protein n=1 Tax=Halovenus carboxidivorans TaxID=2692199 RepID=A0A6B0T2H8_9EURY|nr:ABC transporter ATP-binding protein [Halovenus carboxidivorans]MXR52448.1 ATP-binding cassette domain-containing protein [Halovenus carboxidivorans]